jgi:hypothetical protein
VTGATLLPAAATRRWGEGARRADEWLRGTARRKGRS